MEKIKLSKKLITILLASIFAISGIFVTIFCLIVPNTNAIKTGDTTSFAKVNNGTDLWSGSGINETTAKELLKMLGNSSTGDYSTLQNSVTTSSPKSAKTLRGYTYNKTSSQSIVLRLGGLDWIVTYLSVSNEDSDLDGNNDIIATLWLTNNVQEAWSGRNESVGLYYGFVNGGLYADWSANWSDDNSHNYPYPSPMYGTSYISTVVLNNGGSYATNSSTIVPASTDTNGYGSNNPFYSFTTPVSGAGNDLTDFIITPNKVPWQKTIQDKSLINLNYHCSNDSLDNTGGKFYSSSYDYSNRAKYVAWGDDYLWLPSLVETGYTDSYDGIWETITSERMNYDGSTTNISASTIGNSNSNSCYAYTHIRSAYYDYSKYAYSLRSSGTNWGYGVVEISNAVRPALHLNLSSVYNGGTSDLWDSDNQKFDSKYSKSFMQKLTSDGSGKLDQLVTDITNSSGAITATELYNRNNSKSTYVNLGGIKWLVTYLSIDKNGNPIATLYKADSSSTESSFGNSGSYFGTNSPTSGIPTNMYGTSYIRAVTLNNGGYYINITSNSSNPSTVGLKATQSSSHEYALFTVPSLGLTPHLVQPLNVSWQESGQSAKTAVNFSYNLSNENWSDSVEDTGFYSSGNNYAGNYYTNVDNKQSGNGDWKYDYLWLPSLTETGYSGTNGIWQINQNKRSSSNYNASWGRSANSSSSLGVYTLYPSGANYNNNFVNYSQAMRPALHLNLKSVYDSLSTPVTLDQQSGTGGTTTIEAKGNTPMPSITIPTRSGFAFGGYFSSTNGNGTKYYNADGTSAINYPASGGATTLYAYWIPLYTLTINSNDSNLGTAFGSGSYQANTTHKIYAITKAGYSLLYWSVKNANGTEINKIYENEYTLTMPAHNVTYTAIFGKVIVGVNISSTYGGMVAMVGDNFESLSNSDTITLVATVCITGYQFKHWINQDGTILASGKNNKTYLIQKSLAMDSIITAVFEPIT